MKYSLSRMVLGALSAGLLVGSVGCGPDEAGGRNVTPVIESLTADPQTVRPGGESTLQVVAFDPDGAGGPTATMDVGSADAGAVEFPEGLEVSWSVSSEAWSIAGEGATATLTAEDAYDSQAEVTVTVTDTDGATASESMQFSTGENELPRITSVTATPNPVTPTETVTLEASAEDGNGDELSYSWMAPEGWTLKAEAGATVELTAPDKDGATAQVELEVADPYGGTATRSVQVRTSQNNPPSIASMAAMPPQVEPGGETTVKVEADDADGDDLEYAWTAPMGWTLTGEGAEVTLQAPDKYGASGDVSVTITDARGEEASGRVVVSTATNNGPVIDSLTATPQQVQRKGTLDLAVTASDPDGDMLSYSWSAFSMEWSLMGNGETAKLTAPDKPAASTTVEVVVSDADGKTAKASIVVSTAPNNPPKLESVSATPSQVAPGGTIDLQASATDADGEQLSYKWNAPSGWMLTANGAKATVTAPSDYNKTATIDVTVTDGFGGSSVGSVSVSTAPNQAPVISTVEAKPSTVGKGGTSTLTVTASDPNGDVLSYTWKAPAGWTTKGQGKQITLTAPNSYGKTATVNVTVDDGAGGTTAASVTVSTARNQAPTISGVNANPVVVDPAGTSTLSVTASDPNGDTLGYNWSIPQGWTKTGGSGNSIKVTGPNIYGAKGLFEVAVNDGNGATTKATVQVQTKENNAPVILSSSATKTTLKPGEKTTLSVKATDVDGDSLSYVWNLPKGWTGSSTSNSITLTAPRQYGKTVEVVLEAKDGTDTTKKKFTLKTVANQKPVISSLTASPNPVDGGKDTTAKVKASDPLGDPLTYKWSIDNNAWTITGSGATVKVTSPQQNSTAKLTVVADDGFGEQATKTITVTSTVRLYGFTTHKFTNCGQTGRSGPTLSKCRSSYSTGWDGNGSFFDMDTRGIQEWTVPEDAVYTIKAAGAQGGNNGGNGAIMEADVALKRGDTLLLMVGQVGRDSGSYGHGGGGTFVALGTDHRSATPLVVAGGGGGDRDLKIDASSSTTGKDGERSGGAGGQNGKGGAHGGSGGGAGGGGFYTDGGGYNNGQGGRAFRNGGVGGYGDSGRCWGGFGGGGGCDHYDETGGGGGYSGGGGASTAGEESGGGGGSFITSRATRAATSDGNFKDNSSADTGYSGSVSDLNQWNSGHGYVQITKK